VGLSADLVGYSESHHTKEDLMVVLLALLIVALLFGLGFIVKVLWLLALAALALWIIGFVVAGSERRWYHW
jgi:hypothetical protein